MQENKLLKKFEHYTCNIAGNNGHCDQEFSAELIQDLKNTAGSLDEKIQSQRIDFKSLESDDCHNNREYYNLLAATKCVENKKYYEIENIMLKKLNTHIHYVRELREIEDEYERKKKELKDEFDKKRHEIEMKKNNIQEIDFSEIEIFRSILFRMCLCLAETNIILQNLESSYNLYSNIGTRLNMLSKEFDLSTGKEYTLKIKEYFDSLKQSSQKTVECIRGCMDLNGFLFIVSKKDFSLIEKLVSENISIKIKVL